MPQALANLQVAASGDIYPSRFVALDPSNDFSVVQATANTINLVGISQDGIKFPPGIVQAYGGSGGAQVAASAGDELQIFTEGDVCLLEIGASPVNPGDVLTADADGKGVAATSGQYFMAQCLGAGPAASLIKVFLKFGKV